MTLQARPKARLHGRVVDGEVVPLLLTGVARVAIDTSDRSDVQGQVDAAADLAPFDPDAPTPAPDPTVDIVAWGIGRFDAAAQRLLGPEGYLACGAPYVPGTPAVICDSQLLHPSGPYTVAWTCAAAPIPQFDSERVRTYWAIFEDGEAANDVVELGEFDNRRFGAPVDHLIGSDRAFWLRWAGQGWFHWYTQGPRFDVTEGGSFAAIDGSCVTFWIPQAELELGAASTVRMAASSRALRDRENVTRVIDLAPDAAQPMMAAELATAWTVDAPAVDETRPADPAVIAADDGRARLLVPAGALPDGVSLNDLRLTALEGIDGLHGYELAPVGLVLTKPITIEIDLDAEPSGVPLVWNASEASVDLVDRVEILTSPEGDTLGCAPNCATSAPSSLVWNWPDSSSSMSRLTVRATTMSAMSSR